MTSLLSTLTAAAALSLGATGCLVTGSASLDATGPDVEPAPVEEPAVATVSIDPGASMAVDPGYGVGVFVQYDEGGFWTVFTSCDTEVSGLSCNFDVLAYADPRVTIENVEGIDVESGDTLTLGVDGSIDLETDTAFGMNGMIFDADPGATVTLDVLLDGVSRPDLVYLVSDGRLLSGVPTNPVDLAPAAP